MKNTLITVPLVLLIGSFDLQACDPYGITGLLPENDLYIPAGFFTGTGVDEAEFHRAVDKVRDVYSPIFDQMGRELVITGDWDDGVVNAWAYLGFDGKHYVNITGGLARHPKMTVEGLIGVACHEICHFTGGEPRYPQHPWGAAAEGTADLCATTHCYKEVAKALNQSPLSRQQPHSTNPSPPPSTEVDFLRQACQDSHPEEDQQGANLCLQAAVAGMDLGNVLADFSSSPPVDVQSYDPSEVYETDVGHPKAQCRFDTYFSGALCSDYQGDLPDPTEGVYLNYCSNWPRCWYHPTDPGSV